MLFRFISKSSYLNSNGFSKDSELVSNGNSRDFL